jgi:hypothetical protein
MASGRLGASISSGTTTTNVYEVPSGKTAEVSVTVYNGAASSAISKVTLFISPTGTPSATHTIQLDTLASNNGYERTALVLGAGEFISYKTDKNGVSVTVNGVEYTSNSNEIKQQELITTNTETVIYANAGAKAGTVNISVSLADGSALSDTATCTLYVSPTNAAGGYPIHKYTITGSGITGFEKTGLPISTTDKVILVTTGIVGQVATTTSGYSK